MRVTQFKINIENGSRASRSGEWIEGHVVLSMDEPIQASCTWVELQSYDYAHSHQLKTAIGVAIRLWACCLAKVILIEIEKTFQIVYYKSYITVYLPWCCFYSTLQCRWYGTLVLILKHSRLTKSYKYLYDLHIITRGRMRASLYAHTSHLASTSLPN